jgi:hypothetical protein
MTDTMRVLVSERHRDREETLEMKAVPMLVPGPQLNLVELDTYFREGNTGHDRQHDVISDGPGNKA